MGIVSFHCLRLYQASAVKAQCCCKSAGNLIRGNLASAPLGLSVSTPSRIVQTRVATCHCCLVFFLIRPSPRSCMPQCSPPTWDICRRNTGHSVTSGTHASRSYATDRQASRRSRELRPRPGRCSSALCSMYTAVESLHTTAAFGLTSCLCSTEWSNQDALHPFASKLVGAQQLGKVELESTDSVNGTNGDLHALPCHSTYVMFGLCSQV